jgi:hypothetical protein
MRVKILATPSDKLIREFPTGPVVFLKRLVLFVPLALAAPDSDVGRQTVSLGGIASAGGLRAPVVPESVIPVFAAIRSSHGIPAGQLSERNSNPGSQSIRLSRNGTGRIAVRAVRHRLRTERPG